MTALVEKVREEVERVHVFFVDWFNGTAAAEDLDRFLVPRFDQGMMLVSPDGSMASGSDVIAMFRTARGANTEFGIAITNVEIQHDLGSHLLVTYTEWQQGATDAAHQENARVSTLLMTKREPYKWLHVHESLLARLPDSIG